MRKIIPACASSLAVMLAAGCLYEEGEPLASANASGVANAPDDGRPSRNSPIRQSVPGVSGVIATDKTPVDEPEPAMDDEDIPTDILIATCESSPTEVAVPLNASDDKFCDTVQVYPYRSDDNGSYGVSGAAIEWDLPEQDVAYFAALAYGPGGNVRRLAVGTDAFWAADEWDEPETLLTICAKPPVNVPHAFAPICRSLPVRAAVNLEGAWCFSGETFVGDCHDVEIKQDGRELYVDDDVLPDGRLWVRSIKFNRDNDYVYDGILDSHDYMYGIVRLNGQTEVLGTWTAWRLPLY